MFSAEALATINSFDPKFVKSVHVTNSIPQVISKAILKERLGIIDVSGNYIIWQCHCRSDSFYCYKALRINKHFRHILCDIFLFTLALIAEIVRRHHYCESVSVVGGEFKPIDFKQEWLKLDESNGNVEVPMGIKIDNQSVGELGVQRLPTNSDSRRRDGSLTRTINRPLERIRKGYRLSSKCWD